eukprot:m.238847 g.238847  ORF g.238847 m.238847 type:complete len:324 (-) comp19401_c0_seq2:103-1074(-)
MEELLNIGAAGNGKKKSDGVSSLGADDAEIAAAAVAANPFLAEILKSPEKFGTMDPGSGAATTSEIVHPIAGVCLKTEAENGDKVFINICRSDKIPSPPAVSDEVLALAVATGDNSKYRIPMSVGDPHAEVDTANKGCTAYDVIISEAAFEQFHERDGIKEFMVELILAHIEHKHNVLLSRAYRLLGKRKKLGQLQPQRVRVQKKAIDETFTRPAKKKGSQIQEITQQELMASAKVPTYTLLKEPASGVPEYYILEVELPKVATAKLLSLDVGGQRLELAVHPQLYFLGLDFEYAVDHTETGAQFNKKTRVLSVTLAVAKQQA